MKKNHQQKKEKSVSDNQMIDEILNKHIKEKYNNQYRVNYFFNVFAKMTSDLVGNAWTFILSLLLVIIWGLTGHYFNYSDTWQLVINTSTTIITFLVVFLIQNTQNRDTEILNLKLDELIRAKKGARNHLIDLSSLSDSELKELEKEYLKLCNKRD